MFGDKVRRKRNQLARSLERASVPERPYIGRGPRYLVHPEIALVCAPSLRALAAALRDNTIAFDDGELRAIDSFVSDGAGSAFFGRDPTAALREAVGLQHAVLGRKENEDDRDQHITENDDVLSTRTISVITATVVAALLFAVPALAIVNGGERDRSSGNPRLFQLLLEKNGVVDHSIVDPQSAVSYFRANELATAAGNVAVIPAYRDANERAVPLSTEQPLAVTSTDDTFVDWTQIAIGFAIGMVLALGLLLTVRMWSSKPIAH
jgi:tetrahydromethanopterin S-methyltransferase subunit F